MPCTSLLVEQPQVLAQQHARRACTLLKLGGADAEALHLVEDVLLEWPTARSDVLLVVSTLKEGLGNILVGLIEHVAPMLDPLRLARDGVKYLLATLAALVGVEACGRVPVLGCDLPTTADPILANGTLRRMFE